MKFEYLKVFSVSLCFCLASACNSSVLINAGQSPGARTLQLELCDYSASGPAELIQKDLDFIGQHFAGVIKSNPTRVSEVTLERIKQKYPRLQLWAYWNAWLIDKDNPHRKDLPDAAFIADSANRRYLMFESPETYRNQFLMNAGSTAWQDYSRLRIKEILQLGYHGVFLDDVWGAPFSPDRPRASEVNFKGERLSGPIKSSLSWFPSNDFVSHFSLYLESLQTSFSSKPFFINGLNGSPLNQGMDFAEQSYLPYASAFLMDGFVYDQRRSNKFRDGTLWQATLDVFLEALAQGKQVSVRSYLKDKNQVALRLYALASYLLVANAQSRFYMTTSCQSFSYFPEWNLELGQAQQAFSSIAQAYDPKLKVFARRFEKGMVIVNPDAKDTWPVQLPQAMYALLPSGGDVVELKGDGKIKYQQVQKIELAPRTAVILLNEAPETNSENKASPKP